MNNGPLQTVCRNLFHRDGLAKQFRIGLELNVGHDKKRLTSGGCFIFTDKIHIMETCCGSKRDRRYYRRRVFAFNNTYGFRLAYQGTIWTIDMNLDRTTCGI